MYRTQPCFNFCFLCDPDRDNRCKNRGTKKCDDFYYNYFGEHQKDYVENKIRRGELEDIELEDILIK